MKLCSCAECRFPWCCGNVLDKCLVVRTLRGGKVAYHTHHLQARQVRELFCARVHTHTHTHTHNPWCAIKWHQLGCPDPHTCTSPHFSLISPVPAAPDRNRFSHQLAVSLPQRKLPCTFYTTQSVLIKTKVESENLSFLKQWKVWQIIF